jgi:hypothetical protein
VKRDTIDESGNTIEMIKVEAPETGIHVSTWPDFDISFLFVPELPLTLKVSCLGIMYCPSTSYFSLSTC